MLIMLSIQSLLRKAAALCVLATFTLTASEVNLIDAIVVAKNKLTITVNRDFKRQYLKADFFVEYDPDINLEQFDYSVLSMPVIMNVISIIWISGQIYYVDEMDTELFHSLDRVKKVFKKMYPKTLWNGELRARKLVDHPCVPCPNLQQRTAILYSGGIDSTSTVFAHLDKKQLLITAWGHWDLPLNKTKLWETRKAKIIRFAQIHGNEASFIKSNYSAFLNWEYLSRLSPEIPKWRLGAVEGLGWAGLTTPLLLSKGYPVLRIASSHTWLYPYPSAASPYVDNNICCCGLRVEHDQYDMTRIEKIAFIIKTVKEKNLPKPFLKICSVEKKGDWNCCDCRKCLSSIMGFFALGEDPRGYGMPISLGQAHKKTHRLLAPGKLNAYTILYFKGVQQRIKDRIARGENVPRDLRSLAAINFDHKKAVEEHTQQKINWREMRELLPCLVIPEKVDNIAVPL